MSNSYPRWFVYPRSRSKFIHRGNDAQELLDPGLDHDQDILGTLRAAGYGYIVGPCIQDDEQDMTSLPLGRWEDRKVARSIRRAS